MRVATSTIRPLAISSRAAILVGLLTFALVAVRAPSARASEWNAKEICAAHACRTIAADARVRVFRATDRRGYDIVFAEWLPKHEVREVDFPRSEPLTAVELVGSVFAYAVRYASGTAVEVSVEDFQPGHAGVGGGWAAAEDIEAGSAGVRKLAVTASGSVAWLVEGRFMDPANPEAGPHPNSRAVFCASRPGEPVLLSYGPTITPTGLKADASQCSSRRSGMASARHLAGVAAGPALGAHATVASPFRFERLVVTRQVGSRGLVSFFRLNRRLPYAPRGKYEGEEPGGPRLYAAYLAIDGHYQEGATETMGKDAGRDCYTEAIEIDAHEHQPRVGQIVSVSLVIHGRTVLRVHARVRTRKIGPSVRGRDGVVVSMRNLPYEEALCS